MPSAGVTSAVSRSTSRCWRRSRRPAGRRGAAGGTPAELVRHVGRELGDAHADLAADMVVDEMRGYALPMVDDRWAVQVSALGADVGWGGDAEFLFARRGGAPRGGL